MSDSAISAGQVMDRVANLLNDPQKTDYTYLVQIPYLNMAIEEFSDLMTEANAPGSNFTSHNFTATPIIVQVGGTYVNPPGTNEPNVPEYPRDLVEIQDIKERQVGEPATSLRSIPRKEFQTYEPPTSSLLYWVWERGIIRFNPYGANVPMEIVINYLYQGIPYVTNENSLIEFIGSRTYLAYKTASFCAMFIGENESRAAMLNSEAERAIDRTIAINNKGRQQIMTRHRPFRASFKSRGGF
jgi:hypothetical protein